MEVLVVLAILSVTAAIATPSVSRMVEQRSARAVVQGLAASLTELRVRAHVHAEPIDSEAIADHIRAGLPEGWEVEVQDDFAFNSLGYCTGGEVVLIQPDGARRPRHFAAGGCIPQSETGPRNRAGFAIVARPDDAR
jgi:type II secretory pathway pseudopilin PulG